MLNLSYHRKNKTHRKKHLYSIQLLFAAGPVFLKHERWECFAFWCHGQNCTVHKIQLTRLEPVCCRVVSVTKGPLSMSRAVCVCVEGQCQCYTLQRKQTATSTPVYEKAKEKSGLSNSNPFHIFSLLWMSRQSDCKTSSSFFRLPFAEVDVIFWSPSQSKS